MVANKIIDWVKKNKLIIGVVILSLFLRLFKIPSYMTFLGDEGRDALVWLRMTRGKFTLIGPTTSIGNMYLGPLYYYLMLPFYIVLGTVGPSVGVALFAGVTSFLLWLFGKEWFSEKVGILAAFLYAISPVAIVLSHSSWNPNVMPFFALLAIWGIWQFWQKDKYYWLAIDGVLLSFAVQSHYLGILLLPLVGLFFLVKLVELLRRKDKNWRKITFSFVLCSIFFVLLSVLPLVWFDLRHNFINYKSFYKFFSERQTTVNLKAYKALPQIWPLWQMLATRLIAGKDVFVGLWTSVILGLGLMVNAVSLFRHFLEKKQKSFLLILLWLLTGLLGMGLYKQHIYDHYFGFLFPAIFLLTALMLTKIWEIKRVGKALSFVLLVIITFCSLSEIPLKYSPGYQMQHTAKVDQKILEEAQGKPFNLGMIAKQNYDAGYRYFLEKSGHKPLEIDPARAKETIAEQLFVVCEEKECRPTTHPQAEIANFGWSKIEKEWEFPWGVKLFKLGPY